MKKNYFSWGVLGNESFSKLRFTLILPLIAIMGFSQMQAQEMATMPGKIVTEPIPQGLKDANSRIAMAQMAPGGLVAAIVDRPATADIQLVFGPGAQGNEDVMAAFQFAADIWAREIVSNVPITVNADFADLGAGVLASAGPLNLLTNFPNAPEENVLYPVALANSLAGEDLVPGNADLVVNLGNGVNFSFGTDGNPPPGTFDFVTIALHELGHGLGFIDGGNVNGAGIGNINNGGNPFIFDLFITDDEGNSVLDLPNPSEELGDFLTSGNVFVNGAFAVEGLNGVLPQLFAPNPFQGGSSIAHWNEATFLAGDPNSLMTPQVAPAESIFNIGDITRGHFRDMGWVLADQSPVNVIPGSITEILNIGESVVIELTVNNITDAAINVTATPGDGAVIIGAVDPAAFTLAAEGSTTVSLELTTENAQAGFFDEVLTFAAEGSDLTFSVPVSVQVLDGSEAPVIAVNPELFDITLVQGTFTNDDLIIGNTGNAALDFTISVDDGSTTVDNFRTRVAALNTSITNNGVTTEKVRTSDLGGLTAALTPADGIVSRVIGNVFATDFEDFQLGDLNGQMGWSTQPAGFDISDVNASSGSLHIRATSDGTGTTIAQPLAFSPLFEVGNGTITSMSTRLDIEGSGVSWEFIPQNTAEASVVTRVRFNGDGSIDVLDNTNGAAFVPLTGVTVPEGYFTLTVVIDSGTLAMDVLIDNEIVFSGFGFATTTNQIVYLSDFAVEGSTLDIDDVDIASIVDENAPFVSVNPTTGTVDFGDDTTLNVLFDARNLDPGVFTATIDIESNDPANPLLAIPVTLTVTAPAFIAVNPLSLVAEVDVTLDNPPIADRTITITNNGGTPLEFSVDAGLPVFTAPTSDTGESLFANLDRSIYGGGIQGSSELQSKAVELDSNSKLKFTQIGGLIANATQVADSLFLDSGVSFPPAFVGFGPDGPGLSAGIMFTVPEDEFLLTAVRNAYTTEDFGSTDILLQIYLGGETPDQGELLAEQLITDESADGTFPVVNLNTPLRFTAGQSFWIVHNYPTGIDFVQGFDDTITTTAPGAYAISGDGGATFTLQDGFAFLTRALSTVEDFISLSPSTGIVASGEQVEVSVSFDGSNLANGVYESDIIVNSNDPENPSVAVATTFTVSGQTADISVSEELLLFNDVFVGNSAERLFSITNTGAGNLTITDITSDNGEFTVNPSSATLIGGEELQVVVTYSPEAVGSSNGILSISSDSDSDSDFEVILNGVGVEGPFAVLNPELTQATVSATESVDVNISLSNEGASPLIYSFPEFAMAMALADPNSQLQSAELLNFPNFSSTQAKGFNDTRIGAPVANAMGTDLGFGYTWIDSNAEGGPVNNFVDITAIGQDITALLNDGLFADGAVSLALPFAIPFYGVDQETLFVNANGFVSFEAPTGATFVNGQIPEDDGVNNIIAPFWTDLEPGVGAGGTVHVAAAPNAIIVQWTDNPGFGTTGTVTFEVVIFDDGTVDVYFQGVATASFLANATIGIENSGATDGAQVAFNTAFAEDDLAIRFIPPSRILTNFISAVTPISGVLGVNQVETITVTLDAANLDEGVFLDELIVSSNSPDISRSTATFELTVTEGALAILTPQFNQVTAITGETVEAEITLSNGGGGTLDYSFPEFTMMMALADPNVELQRSEVINFSDFSSNQQKGFKDTRIGSPVINAMGTDLEFGYTWMDSDADGGPVNNFFDITAIGTDVTASLNDGVFADGTVSIPLPFAIPFYGINQETLFINANGFVAFEAPTSALTFLNGQIPVDDGINNIIAPFWTDLEPGVGAGGTVHVAAAPNAIIVQWTDTPGFGTTGTVTFEVVIFDDGTVDVYYEDMETASFLANATVGIENVGATDGALVAFNTEFVRDDFAVRFMPPGPEVTIISAITPLSGSLTAGEEQTITVTLDATELDPGVFLDDLMVSSNSTDISSSTAVFELTVIDSSTDPEITFVLINADTDMAIGPISDGDIIDLGDFPEGTNFNIEAIPNESEVGSVIFDFNGVTNFTIESLAPYALGGDSSGDFRATNIPFGANVLTATTFAGGGGSGEVGVSETINFDFINTFPNSSIALELINAVTDESLGLLQDNPVVDLADFPVGTQFTVQAITSDFDTGSVIFDLNNVANFRTENIAPYALAGDLSSGSDFLAAPFNLGVNTISVTAFTQRAGGGLEGPASNVSFELVDSRTNGGANAINVLLINSDADTPIFTIENGGVINLSEINSGVTIAAEVDLDNVGSVRFGFNGNANFRTENIAPYAINGDDAGNFRPFNFPLGANTVAIEVYDGRNATGMLLATTTVSFTVVEDGEMMVIRMSPNPTPDRVQISLVESEGMVLKASLLNFSGQTIYSNIEMDFRSSDNVSLDVSSLAPGVYIIVLADENGVAVAQEKLVKK